MYDAHDFVIKSLRNYYSHVITNFGALFIIIRESCKMNNFYLIQKILVFFLFSINLKILI